MMDTVGLTILATVILTGCIVHFIGHSFIDAIFKRKEEMINQMIEKGEV